MKVEGKTKVKKPMLTTRNCKFCVNRDGTLDIFTHRPRVFTKELCQIFKMARLHARRKKIKNPVEFGIQFNY